MKWREMMSEETEKSDPRYYGGGGFLAAGTGWPQALSAQHCKPTHRQQLYAKREMLQAELGRVKDALEALDQNQDFERVMTLVSQAL